MKYRLIVNADDYGRTEGVSKGIREAHLKGIVTSTTAMMNYPTARADIRRALYECPDLKIGVHLVLSSGTPLSSPDRIPGLLNSMGRFPDYANFLAGLNKIDLDEVRIEWKAQIEAYIAAADQPPDHLDGHHHCAYRTPGLFRLLLELAREYDCPVRRPMPVESNSEYPDLQKEMNEILIAEKPLCPEIFIEDFYGDGATLDNLLKIIATLEQNKVPLAELMVHPGFTDEALMNSNYNRQREQELAILTDPAICLALLRANFELITFAHLKLLR